MASKWFNIYLNDRFFLFLNTEVCNITDDTTPYAFNADINADFNAQSGEWRGLMQTL